MTKKEFEDIKIALGNNPIDTLYKYAIEQAKGLAKILRSPEYKEFLTSNNIERTIENAKKLDKMLDEVLVEEYGCFLGERDYDSYDDWDYNYTSDHYHPTEFVNHLIEVSNRYKEEEVKEYEINWMNFRDGEDEIKKLEKYVEEKKFDKRNKTK